MLVLEVPLLMLWFDVTVVLAPFEPLLVAEIEVASDIEVVAAGEDPSIIISLVVVSGIAPDGVLLTAIGGDPLLLEVSSLTEGCGASEVVIFEY